jgi:hypothetical protein
MKRDISSIVKEIKSDKRYKRLEAHLAELPLYQIPTDKYLTEIENLHKSRNVRYLSAGQPKFIESLVEASLKEQATRSRLVEISVTCLKAIRALERATENLSDYCLLTYSDIIKFARTKDERVRIINLVLRPFHKFLNEVETLKATCDLVIQDIDKSGYGLKLVVDAHIAATRPERNI